LRPKVKHEAEELRTFCAHIGAWNCWEARGVVSYGCQQQVSLETILLATEEHNSRPPISDAVATKILFSTIGADIKIDK
jgi:hypothetical protein